MKKKNYTLASATIVGLAIATSGGASFADESTPSPTASPVAAPSSEPSEASVAPKTGDVTPSSKPTDTAEPSSSAAPKTTEKEKGVIGAVYETAKYPVKSIDYLTNDRDENLQRVEDLEKGLKSKRLISFGGIFKEIRKELQLEDVESGDLIKTDSEEDKEPTTGQVIIARWNWQRQNYYLD